MPFPLTPALGDGARAEDPTTVASGSVQDVLPEQPTPVFVVDRDVTVESGTAAPMVSGAANATRRAHGVMSNQYFERGTMA